MIQGSMQKFILGFKGDRQIKSTHLITN